MTLISEIMTREVISIEVNEPLWMARDILEKKNIRHLPVNENGRLVGILSLTDVMRLSFGNVYGTDESEMDDTVMEMLSIDQVMKVHPVVINSSDPIRKAAEILTTAEFHDLPVVDNGELVGIVSTTDVIKFLIEEAGE